MMFVSLTRLRIRSLRFLPSFFVHLLRTLRQVRRAQGFRRGALLADRSWTFWTLTAWSDSEHMQAYMTTGSHKKVMPRLLNWCDEASIAHWTQPEEELPTWMEAARRMRESGRPLEGAPSKLPPCEPGIRNAAPDTLGFHTPGLSRRANKV